MFVQFDKRRPLFFFLPVRWRFCKDLGRFLCIPLAFLVPAICTRDFTRANIHPEDLSCKFARIEFRFLFHFLSVSNCWEELIDINTIRGRSQTTFANFANFWPPTYLCLNWLTFWLPLTYHYTCQCWHMINFPLILIFTT